MHILDYILFEVYPYIAGTVFLFGSLVRYDMSQYTWKTNSSQLLNNSIIFQAGSYLFHGGIIFLFFGHLIGLLMPPALYPYFGLTAHSKQILAMVSGGLAGVAALIGATILLYRRLFHRLVSAQSLRGDKFILILLYVQLLFGLGTIPVSAQHLSGAEMEMLVHWAEHIVTFRPGASAYLAGVYWVFKVHLFLGLTVFLVFPFTRLVHIWSVPYRYIGRRYQVVRQDQARSDQARAGGKPRRI
ncbi:respiratory nitrate reductase subunit gamma [Salinisphaera sp. LB1]|uniref:respiratory nitrate reductase subunit gamma n=1 Tax=Salinisphaera sp. LB1 TaxID=2183911 RepID=UPI000D708A64|nr:respiratory nitrate reductase subunit gamma [Salinisphaera sp. LB1]AWN14225.1 Respiratory nitrate reductase gamma chain [Salinisphaera sp. LB1]